MSDGFNCASVDGDNRDNDTGQKKRSQLVDIFDSHKNYNSHQAEAQGAVDPHVVQQGAVTAEGICSMKYGCLRDQIFLKGR